MISNWTAGAVRAVNGSCIGYPCTSVIVRTCYRLTTILVGSPCGLQNYSCSSLICPHGNSMLMHACTINVCTLYLRPFQRFVLHPRLTFSNMVCESQAARCLTPWRFPGVHNMEFPACCAQHKALQVGTWVCTWALALRASSVSPYL